MFDQIPSYPDLTGQVAIITGGAAGIGLAIASAFSEQGCHLVLIDVERGSLSEAAKRIQDRGTDVFTVAGSVAEQDPIRDACAEAIKRWKRVDILVNNAGITAVHPSLELSLQDWKRVLDVNLTGVFVCAQEAARQMIRTGRGVILNISSAYGIVAAPNRVAYCATKAAVAMMSKVLAIEWAEKGLRVNALAPGYVETDLVMDLVKQGKIDLQALARRTPQGRIANPKEIARVAVFLASNASSHITGQVIAVDGGWTAYGYL
jgi:NAD(P)-dependent dehydrogenase (short-subunit alcohol dehydrogenase family)